MKKTIILILFLGAISMARGQEQVYWKPLIPTRGAFPHLGDIEGAPRLRAYSFADGVYESDRETGQPSRQTAEGTELGIGASGYKRWESTALGLDYLSTFRYYSPKIPENGGDHQLTLGLSRTLSRNWKLNVAQSGGIFHRQYLYNPFSVLGESFSGAPGSGVFDDRTYYSASAAGLTYQRSPRLAFEISGRGYVVRRTAVGLAGLNSFEGDAGVVYGVSEHNVLRLDYSASHYTYTDVAGEANLQGLAAGWARRLTRNWEIQLRGGAYRAGRLTLTRESVDPSLAPIVPPAPSVRTSATVRFIPLYDAALYRRFRHATAMVGYTRGVDPGDGVYLLSRREGVQFGYNDAGFGRLHWGLIGGYGRYSSLTETAVSRAWWGGGGVTLRVVQSLHLMARYDANRFVVPDKDFTRDRFRITFGIAFAPREVALTMP
jgi:hypothetical protein